MTLIFLLHLSYIGLGLSFINLLFKNRNYPWYLSLPISYFTGVFIHVVILHLAIIATITSHITCWVLLVLGMLGLFYETWVAIKSNSRRLIIVKSPDRMLKLNISIAILLVPVIYLITIKLVGVPDITFDSTFFWNLKAKYFFYGEHLWTNAFMDVNRVNPHRNYPLYMPIFTFEQFSILGFPDDFISKQGTWIYYFMGMVLFFLLIRQWANTTVALLTVVLMLYSPVYSYNSIQGSITNTYIDFPLSLMIVSSIGLFLRYLYYKSPVDIFGAMVSLSSALLLKEEGMAWFGIFFPFAFIAMFLTQKKLRHSDYAWLALPVLVFIGWYLVRSHLLPDSDVKKPTLEQLLTVYAVFPKMLMAWTKSIFNIHQWGLIPFFVIPAFLLGLLRNLRNIQNLAVFMMVLFYLGVIFFVIMLLDIQKGSFDYYMLRTYDRLILHILPASLLLATISNSRKFITRFTENKV